MYNGHNTYTMATGHVLFYVWLSSLVMQVGGSGGRSPPGKQGGFGGAAGPPNGGPSFQRGAGPPNKSLLNKSPLNNK